MTGELDRAIGRLADELSSDLRIMVGGFSVRAVRTAGGANCVLTVTCGRCAAGGHREYIASAPAGLALDLWALIEAAMAHQCGRARPYTPTEPARYAATGTMPALPAGLSGEDRAAWLAVRANQDAHSAARFAAGRDGTARL